MGADQVSSLRLPLHALPGKLRARRIGCSPFGKNAARPLAPRLKNIMRFTLLTFALVAALSGSSLAKSADGRPKLVLIAGKPSHPPRMHEFNAGVKLLTKCLQEGAPGLEIVPVFNGWPADEKTFQGRGCDRLLHGWRPQSRGSQRRRHAPRARSSEWVKQGVGIGCMHYGVEVVADKAGAQFKRWIGGHYEKDFSCNPIWEPNFTTFPEHPITRGVQPFQIKDEWYFNMRFVDGLARRAGRGCRRHQVHAHPRGQAERRGTQGAIRLAAGPYPHIQAQQAAVRKR